LIKPKINLEEIPNETSKLFYFYFTE